MTIAFGELESVVSEGLVADIFRVERSVAMLSAIGLRASEINSGPGNFGDLFGALQDALTTEAILSIARVYDVPSKEYPTRCIRGVLEYLDQHQLISIREPYQLKLALRSMSAPAVLLDCVDSNSQKFSLAFVKFVRARMDEPEQVENLKKLRQLRDKALAHNEHVISIEGPTWEAIAELTNIAKQTIGVLGWAYFSTGYMANGEYTLTDDANRAAFSLNRLFDKLYGSPLVK